MTFAELSEQIGFEIEAMEGILRELRALQTDLGDRMPTVREKAAAGAFLAQIYGAVENVLKRICRFLGVPLPTGDAWHLESYKRFCEPGAYGLPVLFKGDLAVTMAGFRKFRHVVYHGYAFELDWERMREGMELAEGVIRQFRRNVEAFLESYRSQS